MASGSHELSTRMSSEEQNINEQFILGTVFSHFKRHKVEISSAIKKTFPFLETLRDRELITNKVYEDSLDSCRNLVPVQKVVYNVLEELEKAFDIKFLEALFSEVNMQEYPELTHIYRTFENVIQESICYQENDGEAGEERPTIQLKFEQGAEGYLYSLPCLQADSAADNGTNPDENGLSGPLGGASDPSVGRNDATAPDSAAPDSAQEPEESSGAAAIKVSDSGAGEESARSEACEGNSAEVLDRGVQTNLSALCQVVKKEELLWDPEDEAQPQSAASCNQAPDVIVIKSEDSSEGEEFPEPSTSTLPREPELGNGDTSEFTAEEPMETSSSVVRSGSGADLHGPESEKCCCVMCSSEGVSSGPEERAERNQAPDRRETMENGGQHSGLRKRKAVNTRPLKKRRKKGKRMSAKNKKELGYPELPVQCGDVKGILHKEKMSQGLKEKCIESLDRRRWFTLPEFEVEGKRGASKNWRVSVHCGKWTLKYLIQHDYLPNPPRGSRKKIQKPNDNTPVDPCPRNSDICAVCRGWGQLFCCDTCSRSFHKECHIRHIDPKRSPWNCIFCLMATVQEHIPGQPWYTESEVLKRKMSLVDRLKCEFLLLKLFCCSKRKDPIFFMEPHDSRESSPRKHMWLNKVKKNLIWNRYSQVEAFVQDIRLVFQNHKEYSGENSLGLALENKFEEDFRRIFAISA